MEKGIKQMYTIYTVCFKIINCNSAFTLNSIYLFLALLIRVHFRVWVLWKGTFQTHFPDNQLWRFLEFPTFLVSSPWSTIQSDESVNQCYLTETEQSVHTHKTWRCYRIHCKARPRVIIFSCNRTLTHVI